MSASLLSRWDEFQIEVHDWSVTNFGTQTTLAPLVGMIEEVGEYYTALLKGDNAGCYDAVADALIYCMDFTGRRGINASLFVFLMKSRAASTQPESPAVGLHEVHGRLCHAALKMEQGIRNNEDHRSKMIDALSEWLCYMCTLAGISTAGDLLDYALPTWETVKKRNWKANPNTGVAETTTHETI